MVMDEIMVVGGILKFVLFEEVWLVVKRVMELEVDELYVVYLFFMLLI